MNEDKCVALWNNNKYNKTENTSFSKWKSVRKAEMQHCNEAYPIGYFTRTTESGIYTTVINELRKEFNNEIEISFKHCINWVCHKEYGI